MAPSVERSHPHHHEQATVEVASGLCQIVAAPQGVLALLRGIEQGLCICLSLLISTAGGTGHRELAKFIRAGPIGEHEQEKTGSRVPANAIEQKIRQVNPDFLIQIAGKKAKIKALIQSSRLYSAERRWIAPLFLLACCETLRGFMRLPNVPVRHLTDIAALQMTVQAQEERGLQGRSMWGNLGQLAWSLGSGSAVFANGQTAIPPRFGVPLTWPEWSGWPDRSLPWPKHAQTSPFLRFAGARLFIVTFRSPGTAYLHAEDVIVRTYAVPTQLTVLDGFVPERLRAQCGVWGKRTAKEMRGKGARNQGRLSTVEVYEVEPRKVGGLWAMNNPRIALVWLLNSVKPADSDFHGHRRAV
ncbi:uncharacterized protein N7482_002451 [Penicillium canariense]|uniref:Uncharacterized protein n=1 Tax=Penicillium canariense TaxID=189055 RepID=A0A9W9IFD2_9EURO|nr:uncharacterized protein N7482_002451 [Penicillium canariense]KAJ5176574.1 hypothetical protein N7482_002451 [Penicillium canariense]